ncbi:MAG: zinc-dependent peptidase [Proteobacteria bacterium]|nr:zinc-dependent peptidase [Pseudomonadota bacterium]
MSGWWSRWRESRALERRAIPDALWQETLAHFPFLGWRSDEDVIELRRLSALFLDRKEFSGAHGLEVDDAMAVAIAAQACLPVLRLGLEAYDGFVGIVVHADAVVAEREVTDEHGIVHEYEEELAGEAMQGGPIMLSWHDVAGAGTSADWGYNVVIHEFAHVLDMQNGAADGMPPLAGRAAMAHWAMVMEAQYARFCKRVDGGGYTLLDPYGATGVDEFFAVASETFFVAPLDLKDEHAPLYDLFVGYYRQDPAARA